MTIDVANTTNSAPRKDPTVYEVQTNTYSMLLEAREALCILTERLFAVDSEIMPKGETTSFFDVEKNISGVASEICRMVHEIAGRFGVGVG